MTERVPDALRDDMVAWRRDIHKHPELGFDEARTAEKVASLLESFGLEVHRGIGTTGVVGVLRRGQGNRAIGLRADMDALPIQEANAFAHRSVHDACSMAAATTATRQCCLGRRSVLRMTAASTAL